MEIRTLVASLHTATTAAGNGNSASNPTGGGLIAGTLTGSGYVTAVCVLEASVAGSTWIPLAEPVEFRGHGVVEVEHYYSATAPLVRLRIVSITGTLAVGVYRVEEGDDDPLKRTPSGAFSLAGPLHAAWGNRGIVVVGSSSGFYGPRPGILQASATGDYSAGPAFGPMTWAMALARPDLPVLANYALGSTLLGDQEAQMVQARALHPSHLFFFCGSNDAYNNVPASTIWATLRVWAEECLEWGGVPTIVAPFARVTTSATQAAILTKLRSLIADWCARQHAPAYMVDALGIVAQPGSATLAPKTDYIMTAGSAPNIHLSNMGAVAVGREIAAILGRCVSEKPEIRPLPGYETDATGLELLANPQFLGTDGALPTSWTNTINGAGATCEYANVAKPNGHNALRITFTAAASGNYIQPTQSGVSGRIPVGSWATAGIKVKLVSGGEYLRNCALAIPLKTGDALTAQCMTQDGTEANRKPFTPLNGEEWWIETGRFLKDDTTGGRFQLTCTANGAGVIVLELEAPYCRLSEDGWAQ